MNTRGRTSSRQSRYEDRDYHREKRMQDASYTNMKMSKRDVRYRPDTEGDPCNSCDSFIRPGGCTKVEGSINPRATCDLYEWNGGPRTGHYIGES